MRRVSLVLIILVALGTLSASAGQSGPARDDRGAFDRVVRIVRSMLRMQTHGDGLTPPLPAPRP